MAWSDAMQIGIFAKTFVRPTRDETLDAVLAHGFRVIQFNMSCAGLPSMPDEIDPATLDSIRATMERRSLHVAAVSGTFNMIHPDAGLRRLGLARLRTLAEACHAMGTNVITLCTGTRDPDNMWRSHPENSGARAWADLVDSMGAALRIAEDCDILLAFEPEVTNVVDSAAKGRELLDTCASPRLKVVIDPANLFHLGELARMAGVLDEAFALLGRDIVIAHAKDVMHDGESGKEPAGRGLLDYDRYLADLHAVGFTGPLILHGLEERDVETSLAFLREKAAPYLGPRHDSLGEGPR
jgi:sugar phosphate isomerase/epimerase